jgi:hypothetical protein
MLFYIVNENIEWLSARIYENEFLVIDYWKIIHFWVGMTTFFMISCCKTKKKWFWFIFSMIIFKVIVSRFLMNKAFFISSDGNASQVFDFIASLVGGLVAYFILVKKALRNKTSYVPDWALSLFASVSFAFLWVGSYQYHYNAGFDISEINTSGLNLWAFFLWFVGGFIFLEVYKFIKKHIKHPFFKFILSYVFYFSSLLVVEFIGFYLLGIKESNPKAKDPLLLGLIHGNLVLHVYYTIFPFLIILLYEIMAFLQVKAHIEKPKWFVQSIPN